MSGADRRARQAEQADTHFVEFDRVQSGRQSIALCGDWTDEVDISGTPTCAECRRRLAFTAEDMFGAPTPGTQVHTTLTYSDAGSGPKGVR